MQKLLSSTLLAACLVLASNTSHATVMNFDNTAAPGTGPSVVGGSYTEAGFTLTATGGTLLFTIDPLYDSTTAPAFDGTDYGFFQGSTRSVTLSSASAFSLQSFNAASLFGSPASILTLTGNVNGGGTLSQTFNTQGNAQWSLFSLTNWNNLASVDIASSVDFIGLDNFTLNQSAAVPEPSIMLLLSLGLAGMCWVRRDTLRA